MDTHSVKVRVCYADTDRMGVVYYGNYLRYFEIARTEYLRALGTAYRDVEEQGAFLTVSEATCKYLSPARYDDMLAITTWVDRLRPTRVDFRHVVTRESGGARLAEGHVVLACVDDRGRPMRVPETVTRPMQVHARPSGDP